MHVDFLLTCDYASVTQDRKLNILGVFDRLFGPEAPVLHPLFYVAFHLRDAQVGQHKLQVRVIGEDSGQVVRSMSTTVDIVEENTGHRGIVPIRLAEFDDFGTYFVSLFVDDKRVTTRTLEVVPSAAVIDESDVES